MSLRSSAMRLDVQKAAGTSSMSCQSRIVSVTRFPTGSCSSLVLSCGSGVSRKCLLVDVSPRDACNNSFLVCLQCVHAHPAAGTTDQPRIGRVRQLREFDAQVPQPGADSRANVRCISTDAAGEHDVVPHGGGQRTDVLANLGEASAGSARTDSHPSVHARVREQGGTCRKLLAPAAAQLQFTQVLPDWQQVDPSKEFQFRLTEKLRVSPFEKLFHSRVPPPGSC